jgi:anti-sigma factor RsiW
MQPRAAGPTTWSDSDVAGGKMSDLRDETGRPVTGDELHAYVDSQVAPDRRPAVVRYLLAHPESARRVEAYATQRDMLRAALAGPASEPIPQRLRPQLLIRQRLAAPTAGSATDNPVARRPLVPDPRAKAASPGKNANPLRARPVLTD